MLKQLRPLFGPFSTGQKGPNQCCGSGMFIPDPGSEFFHPGSRIQGQKDFGSRIRIRIKEFKYRYRYL
jgi:hypothetical protein